MISKKDEILDDLETILGMVFSIQESLSIISFLRNDKEDEDNDEIYFKKLNSFLVYSVDAHMRTVVLELCNIYDSTQDYSLIKLLKQFNNRNDLNPVNFSIDKIREWKNSINNFNPILNQLKIHRNKVFAHQDRNQSQIDTFVTYNDCSQLLDLAKEIVKEIKLELTGSSIQFEMIASPFDGLKSILYYLAKLKKNNQL